jgi:uncharacterized membrane protein
VSDRPPSKPPTSAPPQTEQTTAALAEASEVSAEETSAEDQSPVPPSGQATGPLSEETSAFNVDQAIAAQLALRKAIREQESSLTEVLLERQELRAAVVQSQFRGPLPPPSMLAEYDQVVPGLALQLAKSLDEESKHRRAIELRDVAISENLVTGDLANQRLGMHYGFAIFLTGMIVTGILGVTGHEIAAAIIGGLGIASVATAFITRATKAMKTNDEADSRANGEPGK